MASANRASLRKSLNLENKSLEEEVKALESRLAIMLGMGELTSKELNALVVFEKAFRRDGCMECRERFKPQVDGVDDSREPMTIEPEPRVS